MKNILLTLFLPLLFVHCTKNQSEALVIPPLVDTTSHIIDLGKVSLKRNWIPWSAVFTANYYPNDKSRFYIQGKANQHGYDHIFKLRDIRSKEGLQLIERLNFWNDSNSIPDASYYAIAGGDALVNTYQIDSTRAGNYIDILHYDSATQIVEGRFQAVLEGPTTAPFLWDTIKLTEGKFRLQIRN